MDAVFRSKSEYDFVDLPAVPIASSPFDDNIDEYWNTLNNYIQHLNTKCTSLQDEEKKEMEAYAEALGNSDGVLRSPTDFLNTLKEIRRRRKAFRGLEFDALQERQRYLDSMLQQQQEQEYLRYKLWKLQAIPENKIVRAAAGGDSKIDIRAIVFIFLQIAWFIFTIKGVEFKENPNPNGGDFQAENNLGGANRVDDYFTFYFHMAMMLFFGWGMTATWLKKHLYSSLVFSFLLACFAMEWCYMSYNLFWNIRRDDFEPLPMSMNTILVAIYGATTCVVSYGAYMGKVGPTEILLVGFVESFLWALNYYICILVYEAVDTGAGVTTHLFGAMFGICCALFVNNTYQASSHHKINYSQPNYGSSYTSDVMSLMGTIFLWVTFPSFNAALAPDTSQHRVIINTFLSLSASVIVGFLLSRVFNERKFEMRDIQVMTLAGGIGIASAHVIIEEPAVGIVVGIVSALASSLWGAFVAPWIERRFNDSKFIFAANTHDTRKIFSVHGISGFIAGLASIIATAMSDNTKFGLELTRTDGFFGRGLPRQAGFQTAMVFTTIGISAAGGLVCGKIIELTRGSSDSAPFSDNAHFQVPMDFPLDQ